MKTVGDPDTVTTIPRDVTTPETSCTTTKTTSVCSFQQDQNLPNQYFLITPKADDDLGTVTIRTNLNGFYLRISKPCFPNAPNLANRQYKTIFDSDKIQGDANYFKITQNGANYQFESVAYPGSYLGKGIAVNPAPDNRGFRVIGYVPLTLVTAPQDFTITSQ